MESPPVACRSPRASGANVIRSNMAWRLVLLSFMLLLGEGLASQSRFANTDYGHCKGNTSLLGNGVCDVSVNTADCGFDGGDCCECTCLVNAGSPCDRAEAGFSCQDPDAPVDCDSMQSQYKQVSTAASSYPKCVGIIPHIRDGRCNEANNNASCGFDGGDCCPDTCTGGLAYSCGGDQEGGGFDCRDPHVITPRRRLSSSDSSCGLLTGSVGDTRCDSALNNFECGYDGGDCCVCTCSPDLRFIKDEQAYVTNYCLDGDFDCLDPLAGCESNGEIPAPVPTTPGPIYIRPVLVPTPNPVPSPTVSPVPSPTVKPVPSPTYVSPVPSPTARPVPSPVASPAPRPTERPVPSNTEAPSESDSPSQSDSVTEGDSVSADSEDIEEERATTSSATLTATTTTGTFFFYWEVVVVLVVSVLGTVAA